VSESRAVLTPPTLNMLILMVLILVIALHPFG